MSHINGPDECEHPPLVAAAGKNDLNMIKELLARGANPNRIGALGNPALADTTSVDCALELLQKGADINLKGSNGKTALMVNLIRGSVKLLQCYIEAGADVNACDNEGHTVLMLLTENPRTEVAEMLIGAGANLNALWHSKCSVLDYIYQDTSHNFIRERVDLIALLESKGAKRAKDLKRTLK